MDAKSPTFFMADLLSAESEENNVYERIDEYLKALEIYTSDPNDIIGDFFNEAKLKAFETSSQKESISMNSSSPFILTSPLASSLILGRETTKRDEDDDEMDNKLVLKIEAMGDLDDDIVLEDMLLRPRCVSSPGARLISSPIHKLEI